MNKSKQRRNSDTSNKPRQKRRNSDISNHANSTDDTDTDTTNVSYNNDDAPMFEPLKNRPEIKDSKVYHVHNLHTNYSKLLAKGDSHVHAGLRAENYYVDNASEKIVYNIHMFSNTTLVFLAVLTLRLLYASFVRGKFESSIYIILGCVVYTVGVIWYISSNPKINIRFTKNLIDVRNWM